MVRPRGGGAPPGGARCSCIGWWVVRRRGAGRRPVGCCGGGGSRGVLRADLARTSARALAGDDDPVVEDLAAPDTPRLTAVERAGQAGGPDGALAAEGLGLLQPGRALGEPQLGLLDPAPQEPARGGGVER